MRWSISHSYQLLGTSLLTPGKLKGALHFAFAFGHRQSEAALDFAELCLCYDFITCVFVCVYQGQIPLNLLLHRHSYNEVVVCTKGHELQ